MEIESVSGNPTAKKESVSDVFERIGESIESHENRIRKSFEVGLADDSPLMSVPDHVKAQFERWDNTFNLPEDKALVEKVKRQVLELTNSNRDYVREKVIDNAQKAKLEMAMKAVSKTTQGIQQLLSAQ
ncbi:hypothetical protein [Epibacterium ulvae]|uniref:Phasin protein n=2 Tax=Alphaproteobacteria TaxID=28211 RepID=A0A1G5QJC3_9RHOB|nr:hypothetical protein [Epibacterium ulvae]AGI04140.1 hypothetical protein [alpha proteobacterium U95]SCZ61802.1 hypothetical protein SAMN04488118_104294 [Epibacterium ulvae]